MFAERLVLYNDRIAQARNVILFSCKPHIQLTLETIETTQECWDKLASSYASEGLIYVHDVWLEFDRCSYNEGYSMETFCGTYQAILDRCASVDIIIQPKIQVIKFVGILDSHFEHWCASKREGMRQSAILPTLESLMYEICDESKRLKQRIHLQAHAHIPSRPHSVVLDTCTNCGLPRHKVERCWYKFPHLRREGWQPNAAILKKIRDNSSASNVQLSSTNSNIDSDIFAGAFTVHSSFLFLEQNAQIGIPVWIADSGASHHCCKDLALIIEYQPEPLPIQTGNGSMVSPGYGKVHLELRQSNNSYLLVYLANVRYTPTSSLNTISEELLEKRGISWRSEYQQFRHLATNSEFACITKHNSLRLFHTRQPVVEQHVRAASISKADINCVHQRLGHLHIDGIKQLFKQEGHTVPDTHSFTHCEPCSLAKSTMIICRKAHTRADTPFQKVHIDLCGKTTVTGIGNKSYYLIITDDYSRYRWSACLSTKDQVAYALQTFFKLVKTQYQHVISELHFDNGTECSSQELLTFLDQHGCKIVLTAPYHHSQNDIAERAIGVITSRARTMLLGTNLPPQLL